MALTDIDFEIGAFVPGADDLPDQWQDAAHDFRAREAAVGRARLNLAYGEGERQKLDLFQPAGKAQGLVVFIHGGYWMRFDRSFWSHYAAGLTARDWAVAMPSYTLAPEARVSQMTREIARAVDTAAGLIAGPIRITGHSAGGHLSSRMGCRDVVLADQTRDRIARITPISPVTDLRPLVGITRNDTLHLDEAEAEAESPVLHPTPEVPVSVWVGSQERPVFLDQAQTLAKHWNAEHRVDPGRNHFDILDGLADPESPLINSILS
jgi:acetyl esterase/lipase